MPMDALPMDSPTDRQVPYSDAARQLTFSYRRHPLQLTAEAECLVVSWCTWS